MKTKLNLCTALLVLIVTGTATAQTTIERPNLSIP